MTDTSLPSARDRLRAFARKWRNSSFSSLDHIWMVVLWAVSTPVFIRTLGEDAFGIWVLISTLVGMGGVVSFGFGEATVRFVSKALSERDTDRIRRVVETSLTLYALTGVAFAGAVYLLAPWLATQAFELSPELQAQTILGFHLASFVIFVTAFLKTLEAVINGYQRYDITAKVGMVTRSVVLLTNVGLALLGYPVWVMVLLTAIGMTAMTAVYFPQSGLKPPTLVGKTFKRAPKALMNH